MVETVLFVIFGFAGPLRDGPPDLVISGINDGTNAGRGVLQSGTVGGAMIAPISVLMFADRGSKFIEPIKL